TPERLLARTAPRRVRIGKMQLAARETSAAGIFISPASLAWTCGARTRLVGARRRRGFDHAGRLNHTRLATPDERRTSLLSLASRLADDNRSCRLDDRRLLDGDRFDLFDNLACVLLRHFGL